MSNHAVSSLKLHFVFFWYFFSLRTALHCGCFLFAILFYISTCCSLTIPLPLPPLSPISVIHHLQMPRHTAIVAAKGNVAFGLEKGYKVTSSGQGPKISRRKGVRLTILCFISPTLFSSLLLFLFCSPLLSSSTLVTCAVGSLLVWSAHIV